MHRLRTIRVKRKEKQKEKRRKTLEENARENEDDAQRRGRARPANSASLSFDSPPEMISIEANQPIRNQE